MNNFEKLLMVVVPLSGLTMIFYFFTFYASNLDQVNFYESQRLQGYSYGNNVAKKLPIQKQKIVNRKIIKKAPVNNNYIKWQSDKVITQIPQSFVNRKYEQTRQQPSNTNPIQNYEDQSLQYAKQKYHQQRLNRKIKQQQTKIRDRECSNYEQQKEKIRDRMRRGYKASQYNWLENKRKYWAKLYADNCFSGYQYPR